MNLGYYFIFLIGVPFIHAQIADVLPLLEPHVWAAPESPKDFLQNLIKEQKDKFVDVVTSYEVQFIDKASYKEFNEHSLMGTNTKLLYANESNFIVDDHIMKNLPVARAKRYWVSEKDNSIPFGRCEITREKSCDIGGCSDAQLVKTCNKLDHVTCGSTIWPKTSYIKLLVVVHSSFMQTYHNSVEAIIAYLINFWTAVDFRFRDFACPQVRLSIVGIIISKDKEIDVLVNQHGHISSSLNLCLRQDEAVPHYDAIVGMEHVHMDAAVPYVKLIEGISNGRFCGDQNNYVYVRDMGILTGVLSAVRGIVQLFGVEKELLHDPNSDSYTTNLWSFSFPLADKVRQFFLNSSGTCLYRRPNIGTPFKKLLLRARFPLNQQCGIVYGHDWKWNGPDGACERLFCSSGSHIKDDGIPAEGSLCSNNRDMVCVSGTCVAEEDLMM